MAKKSFFFACQSTRVVVQITLSMMIELSKSLRSPRGKLGLFSMEFEFD